MLAHKTTKKEPITPEILAQLVDRFAGKDADLGDLHIVTWCLVGFAGFLRFNELSTLKESDLQILSDHMEIFIESSKTDQYRDGAWVTIVRTATKTCPVTMVERYVSLEGICASPDFYFFRGITRSKKNGVKLRQQGGLSYSRMRELLLEKLSAVGLRNMVSIALEQVEQLPQRILGCQTGCSRDMAVGIARIPKMVTLRTL
jgi:hypothetical protein